MNLAEQRRPFGGILIRASLVMALIGVVPSLHGESLLLEETRYLSLPSMTKPFGFISALLLGGDSIVASIAGGDGGIWAQLGRRQPWTKAIGCQPPSADWWTDCDDKKGLGSLYYPGNLGFLPESREILVFETRCGRLIALHLGGNEQSTARAVRRRDTDDYLDCVSFQGDFLFVGIYNEHSDMMLAVEKLGRDESYRRMLPITAEFQRYLDSVGLGYTNCMTAMSPFDSNLWVSINGYDHILLADIDGNLLDSVPISAPDFLLPQPPVSRVKSQAVMDLWAAKWTPITALRYASPGYFLLQYNITNLRSGPDTLPTFGTSIWNTDRQQVDLDVDPHWQMAGVSDDGRIIFGHYEPDSVQGWRIEFNIVRIEP